MTLGIRCEPPGLRSALNRGANGAARARRGADGALTEYDVTGFEVMNWESARKRNRESLFPKVVGYAEIARMAGASRQRAYCFSICASLPTGSYTAWGLLSGWHEGMCA